MLQGADVFGGAQIGEATEHAVLQIGVRREILILLLRRQSVGVTWRQFLFRQLHFRQLLAKQQGFAQGDALHRALGALEFARIALHHLLVLFLRHFVFAHAIAGRHPDQYHIEGVGDRLVRFEHRQEFGGLFFRLFGCFLCDFRFFLFRCVGLRNGRLDGSGIRLGVICPDSGSEPRGDAEAGGCEGESDD